jgi:hypothetical protein
MQKKVTVSTICYNHNVDTLRLEGSDTQNRRTVTAGEDETA